MYQVSLGKLKFLPEIENLKNISDLINIPG